MRQTLFILLALLSVVASAQTSFVSLGTIRNRLVERNLEVRAYFNNGDLSSVEFECPTSDYMVGTISIKAEDLPRFREVMGKIRPGMDILKEKVEQNGYGEVSTSFDNINIKATYKWEVYKHENDGPLEIYLTHDAKGRYTSSILHKAFDDNDDNFVAPFFMQFRSLYEVDYLLLLLTDENIELSAKKDDLLKKIKTDK